jgi:hypothetical protein
MNDNLKISALRLSLCDFSSPGKDMSEEVKQPDDSGSVASHCSSSFDAMIEEYGRNCRKNICQSPERLSHWIEADPKDILQMIDRIKHLESKVDGLEDHLDVTIGALRLSSEKAVALRNLLGKASKLLSYAAVSANGQLWQDIKSALSDD